MRVLLAAAFVLSMAEISEHCRCLIGPEGGLVQTGVAPDPEA
jgi:hypothetical protein